MPKAAPKETPAKRAAPRSGPRIGFVSLGCPKALVDFERIITKLRAEGYELSRSYGAPTPWWSILAVSSTAPRKSCLRPSARHWPRTARSSSPAARRRRGSHSCRHPGVLAITGPHQYEAVVERGAQGGAPLHDPFLDLVPPEGSAHAPSLRLFEDSEGCNNACSFCIIPPCAGKLEEPARGEVMREAERLVGAGVKELLVISAGHHRLRARYRVCRSRWQRRKPRDALLSLADALGSARRLGAPALRLSLSACRSGVAADGGGTSCPTSTFPSSTRPRGAEGHAAAGGRRRPQRIRRWREAARISRSARPSSSAFPARPRRTSPCSSIGSARRSSPASAASNTKRWTAPPPMRSPGGAR